MTGQRILLKNSMKRPAKNTLSKYRAYTIQDIVGIFDVTPRTVSRWIDKGLTPMAPDTRPLLFRGGDLRAFYDQAKKRKKCPLKKHQFFCPACKKAVSAKEKSIQMIGNRRHAQCKECGNKVNRFTSKQSENIRAP